MFFQTISDLFSRLYGIMVDVWSYCPDMQTALLLFSLSIAFVGIIFIRNAPSFWKHVKIATWDHVSIDEHVATNEKSGPPKLLCAIIHLSSIGDFDDIVSLISNIFNSYPCFTSAKHNHIWVETKFDRTNHFYHTSYSNIQNPSLEALTAQALFAPLPHPSLPPWDVHIVRDSAFANIITTPCISAPPDDAAVKRAHILRGSKYRLAPSMKSTPDDKNNNNIVNSSDFFVNNHKSNLAPPVAVQHPSNDWANSSLIPSRTRIKNASNITQSYAPHAIIIRVSIALTNPVFFSKVVGEITKALSRPLYLTLKPKTTPLIAQRDSAAYIPKSSISTPAMAYTKHPPSPGPITPSLGPQASPLIRLTSPMSVVSNTHTHNTQYHTTGSISASGGAPSSVAAIGGSYGSPRRSQSRPSVSSLIARRFRGHAFDDPFLCWTAARVLFEERRFVLQLLTQEMYNYGLVSGGNERAFDIMFMKLYKYVSSLKSRGETMVVMADSETSSGTYGDEHSISPSCRMPSVSSTSTFSDNTAVSSRMSESSRKWMKLSRKKNALLLPEMKKAATFHNVVSDFILMVRLCAKVIPQLLSTSRNINSSFKSRDWFTFRNLFKSKTKKVTEKKPKSIHSLRRQFFFGPQIDYPQLTKIQKATGVSMDELLLALHAGACRRLAGFSTKEPHALSADNSLLSAVPPILALQPEPQQSKSPVTRINSPLPNIFPYSRTHSPIPSPTSYSTNSRKTGRFDSFSAIPSTPMSPMSSSTNFLLDASSDDSNDDYHDDNCDACGHDKDFGNSSFSSATYSYVSSSSAISGPDDNCNNFSTTHGISSGEGKNLALSYPTSPFFPERKLKSDIVKRKKKRRKSRDTQSKKLWWQSQSGYNNGNKRFVAHEQQSTVTSSMAPSWIGTLKAVSPIGVPEFDVSRASWFLTSIEVPINASSPLERLERAKAAWRSRQWLRFPSILDRIVLFSRIFNARLYLFILELVSTCVSMLTNSILRSHDMAIMRWPEVDEDCDLFQGSVYSQHFGSTANRNGSAIFKGRVSLQEAWNRARLLWNEKKVRREIEREGEDGFDSEEYSQRVLGMRQCGLAGNLPLKCGVVERVSMVGLSEMSTVSAVKWNDTMSLVGVFPSGSEEECSAGDLYWKCFMDELYAMCEVLGLTVPKHRC